jgi:hypothetical protein
MEKIVHMRSCGLLQLNGVVGWEFWLIGGELGFPSAARDYLERGNNFSCSVCMDTESLITWMMDLGRSSLDGRDLGK